MNRPALNKAFHEAHRFLAAVQDLKNTQPEPEGILLGIIPRQPEINPGRHTAAVRRASMDLTKALAELRKS